MQFRQYINRLTRPILYVIIVIFDAPFRSGCTYFCKYSGQYLVISFENLPATSNLHRSRKSLSVEYNYEISFASILEASNLIV